MGNLDMKSGRQGQPRFRFDGGHSAPASAATAHAFSSPAETLRGPARLAAAIERTRDYLLSKQAPEGYWVGELEGDTILESEYILLLAYLGQSDRPTACRCG